MGHVKGDTLVKCIAFKSIGDVEDPVGAIGVLEVMTTLVNVG